MKKLLSIIILAVFFVSFASAVNSYGYWTADDSSDTYNIMEGDDANFNAYIITASKPMTININLYNSNMDFLTNFEDNLVVNEYWHDEDYTIASSMYNIPGTYYVKIIAEDDNNDIDTHTLTLIVEEQDVDTNAPILSISNPVDGEYYNSNIFDVAYDVADPEGNLQMCWYSLDNGNTNFPLLGCGGTIDNLQVSEGSNTLTIYADDYANNIGSATVTFNVDTIAPEISIIYPFNDVVYSVNINSLQYSVSDTNLDSCSYSIDGGETIIDADCSGSITGLDSVEGVVNHWIVYTEDLAGNNAMSEVRFTIELTAPDTTAPVVTIISPEEGKEYDDRTITFTYSVIDENIEECWLMRGSEIVTLSKCEDSITLEAQEGTNVWTLYGRDSANNVGSATVTFYVDTSLDEDDDDDNPPYKRLYYYTTTYEDDLYFEQFEPKVIDLGENDLTVSDDEQSWFGKLWKAIVNFFEGLFGFQ